MSKVSGVSGISRASAHMSVVGLTVALVAGLREVAPGVPPAVMFVGGLVVAVLGFAGLWLSGRSDPRNGGE